MPPRKKNTKSAVPTPVEAITHADKRANLPTADAQEFVSSEIEEIPQLRYPRDPSLDPQLVWKGKDEQDSEDLEVDAPPIYIQEKIDPRVLIENLRQTAKAGESEPEMTLFESFDGLGDLDLVDFYRHDANWSNRMILGDSLQVMASLAERESLRGKVQMIYIDPPYGIKFGSNWQASTRKRDVKDGKVEDSSREAEMIKAFRDTWELGIHSYLSYLRDRLQVAKDLLTESGSVFVQIGDENVHLVRSVMDEVFGSENFAGQFSFRTKIPLRTTLVPAIYDHIVWYAHNLKQVKFRRLFNVRRKGGDSAFSYVEEVDRTRRRLSRKESHDIESLPPGSRLFRLTDLVSAGRTESCVFEFTKDGATYSPSGRKSWKTNPHGMQRLLLADRVEVMGKTPGYVFFADDYPVEELDNVWSDTQGASDKEYVVQTATKVIQRCTLMTTDPGDLVLDPTCGSGTTAYVAEQWGRRWITIDSSRVALALSRRRLMSALYPYYLLADSPGGVAKEAALTGIDSIGSPTGDIRRGFVFDRVRHVTLGSIAQNPEIVEGMTREEIDAAIERHADYELLVDKPYEDKKKVRVAGPFTVESLSPHRSLAFASSGVPNQTAGERAAVEEASAPSFEATILENLRKAGIQNGRKKERLAFDLVESYAGAHIQAVGIREDAESGPKKVGIAIGPQYGTVDGKFIKDAARAGIADGEMDMLAVLAFAFDPRAIEVTGDEIVAGDEGFDVAAERSLGRLPVLLVRMNTDLLMGEDLKKTGTGNLFTVFGEPDINIKEEGDEFVVELRGVDVYDPTTGEVRSNATDQIALWMIDTNYNEESFFVRHCYFTGGNDPYKRLKTALKADIDADAWESLYKTTSRPFPRPENGKIAVKVINDYGDEVMKVFEV